jgi:hypothetical protein
MLYQSKVGSQLYVWSQTPGGMSPNTTECVISAHGGASIINSTFVSGVNLIFYCPHGSTLIDAGILPDILLGTIVSQPPVAPGQCQDYTLSKYQGRHSDGYETYDMVQAMDERTVKDAGAFETQAEQWIKTGLTQEDVQTFEKGFNLLEKVGDFRWKDIVTIRNRGGRLDPMLSEVIAMLQGAGFTYSTIHCSFCRSSMLPWKASPQHRPARSY